ncbi:MAG: serine/threonine-protein phosphatase 2A catalytic subunit [Candidatus Fermentimicrarchaeum limneticum]|uniref:Serine/threonine-protein phosphatase 2A catalytic subunit n=1 Tax=Fermentimicrarchaeum limneticum TaxID=2795018 RepID=A0A7D5XJ13_FERL1|nr:MAG: serine/threonine-protein phosphatase 2A catalytic subunit [Candidatus Fermentimicrarchaeum limneticum]
MKEGQPMREAVEHLRLDTEHSKGERKVNFLYNGWNATIGTASPAQLGKVDREHIQIHDKDGLVSEVHGRISFENGRIYYTHLTDKPTFIVDADGKPALTITEKNMKIAINPSQTLILPDHSKISFMFGVDVKVSEPEQAKSQKKYTLDEIFNMADKSASVLKTSIDRTYDIIEKEREAGKLGMGIDRNMNQVKGGMWVEGSLVHLPKEGKAILVGDIHSRPDCLRHILEETKFVERVQSGEKLYLVFMGDYADRNQNVGDGIKSVGVVKALKGMFTNNVVILQGNHDNQILSLTPHEFPLELESKYGGDGTEIYLKYRKLFEQMPLAVKMENGIFVSHAGAASTVRSLSDVVNPSRATRIQMTWNDPDQYASGYVINSGRGFTQLDEDKAFVFGGDALDAFLGAVGSRVLVRAHEQRVSQEFNGKCLTLNSTDYKNAQKAYAVIDLSKEVYGANQIELHYF